MKTLTHHFIILLLLLLEESNNLKKELISKSEDNANLDMNCSSKVSTQS